MNTDFRLPTVIRATFLLCMLIGFTGLAHAGSANQIRIGGSSLIIGINLNSDKRCNLPYYKQPKGYFYGHDRHGQKGTHWEKIKKIKHYQNYRWKRHDRHRPHHVHGLFTPYR